VVFLADVDRQQITDIAERIRLSVSTTPLIYEEDSHDEAEPNSRTRRFGRANGKRQHSELLPAAQAKKPEDPTVPVVVEMSVSIGAVMWPDAGEPVSGKLIQLIEHADARMYWAKEHGKNRVCFFDPTSGVDSKPPADPSPAPIESGERSTVAE
jgi:GGDEF domain-containing protein